MKPGNPFIITGYYSPEYFCNREQETERIISALKNGRNITLFSIRRLGKTGLIEHVFHKLKTDKNLILLYMDILPTEDLSGFINLFASAVLKKFESKPGIIIKKIGKIFANARPVITFDPYTGIPNIQLSIQSEDDANKSLEDIFNYIRRTNKRTVIAIDEFQQITNYPEKNVEAVLRTYFQKARNVSFIFSGSRKHILLSIFGRYGKPFYQSTEMMQLERIDNRKYGNFIISKFLSAKKNITWETVSYILEICRSHTYYVQLLCNRLYGLKDTVVRDAVVKELLNEILKENEAVYINYKNLLTGYQWNVLKAIAKEGNANLITSKDFISKYKLGTPSSVHTAVKSLLNKELIYKEKEEYFVYDVFLERWLERM